LACEYFDARHELYPDIFVPKFVKVFAILGCIHLTEILFKTRAQYLMRSAER